MFASLPITSQSKSNGDSFISNVDNEEFLNLEERKILCFFDADCDHCSIHGYNDSSTQPNRSPLKPVGSGYERINDVS